jgi:hypothetical protein
MSGDIPKFIEELRQISAEAKNACGALSAEQLNWKAAADKWSIGQCFDHLIVTNKMELRAIEKAVGGAHTQSFWEKLPVLPTVFGRLLLGMVDPQNAKKFKAPKNFRPARSDVRPEILEEYFETTERVIELMRASEKLDTKNMIITSPIPRITYSLFTAYKALALHDRRHFNQAKSVMETDGFPR